MAPTASVMMWLANDRIRGPWGAGGRWSLASSPVSTIAEQFPLRLVATLTIVACRGKREVTSLDCAVEEDGTNLGPARIVLIVIGTSNPTGDAGYAPTALLQAFQSTFLRRWPGPPRPTVVGAAHLARFTSASMKLASRVIPVAISSSDR
jgi:hypothetical protein